MKTINIRDIESINLGEVIEQLKDEVSIEVVANELDLTTRFNMTKMGNFLQGDCPTGHESSGHRCFSINFESNLFYCFNCKEAGDIVQLVTLVEGKSTFESAKWIAGRSAPQLMDMFNELAHNQIPEQKEFYQKASLYEMIYEEGKGLLYEPIGKVALDYLTQTRGYDRKNLEKTDFIFWDTDANIRKFLTAKAPGRAEDIASLPLHGAFGDNFRLAIPYRDRRGAITGFLKRAHVKEGFNTGDAVGVRWDSTKGLEKKDLFGLNRIRKQDTLILLEGYPDATYFPSIGLTNAVAFGQAAFSEKYLEGLIAKGIKRLILALDIDEAGQRNTEEICRLFAERPFELFVVDSKSMGSHKDPDEYVAAKGVDAFKKLVESAESAPKWMAKRILSQRNVTTDLGKAKAIDEILEYADSLPNPFEAQQVVDLLHTTLGLAPEILSERMNQVKEKLALQNLESDYKEVTRKAQLFVRKGMLEEAVEILSAESIALLNDFRQHSSEPRIPLNDFLRLKQASDASRKLGQPIGYLLNQFPAISDAMDGLQPGLILIGADPNTGKTILSINLAVDLLMSNDQANVLFYTLDDSRDTIATRFISKLSGIPINSVKRKAAGPAEEKLLTDAYDWLENVVSAGRLEIIEQAEGMTISSIYDDIRRHPNTGKLVVFMDGIYNIPLDSDYPGIREENIARANALKDIVKLYKVPVIGTAELRKRNPDDVHKKTRTIHDIMESAKYGYNADVILLLTPQNLDSYRKDVEPLIDVSFEKNKLSGFRDTITLKFLKAQASFMQEGSANPFAIPKGGN